MTIGGTAAGQVPSHGFTFGPSFPSLRSTTNVSTSPSAASVSLASCSFNANRSSSSDCSISRICLGVAGAAATPSTV